MKAFKLLLVLQLIGIILFTLLVGTKDGWDLVSVAFKNFSAMNWAGQFQYDFSCYLILSAVWVGWRHHFSFKGILLATAASILGILFFSPYLLFLLTTHEGNLNRVLLGENRGGE